MSTNLEWYLENNPEFLKNELKRLPGGPWCSELLFDRYECVAVEHCTQCRNTWFDEEHEEEDSQEAIDSDAVMTPTQYCRKYQINVEMSGGFDIQNYIEAMVSSLLARQRMLDYEEV